MSSFDYEKAQLSIVLVIGSKWPQKSDVDISIFLVECLLQFFQIHLVPFTAMKTTVLFLRAKCFTFYDHYYGAKHIFRIAFEM